MARQPLSKYFPLRYADFAVAPDDVRSPTEESAEAGVGLKIARARYDFAVDGGVIGAINLLGATDIPANALVLGTVVNVLVTVTTAGADAGTLALSVEGADDLVAAIAVADASNPWDAGTHQYWGAVAEQVVPLTTVARDVVLTIGGQAVTAGQLDVYLFYVELA